MNALLFYVFATLTLLSGLLVVANPFSRNPVTNAMFLVLSIVSMAGLFVLLRAFFLAAVQILVYAGAVIVLFLFVIMLLDLGEEQRRRYRKAVSAAGFVAIGAMTGLFVKVILNSDLAPPAQGPVLNGETIPLGHHLFTHYLLPFEVVSVLLLVAVVGAILLSKKDIP